MPASSSPSSSSTRWRVEHARGRASRGDRAAARRSTRILAVDPPSRGPARRSRRARLHRPRPAGCAPSSTSCAGGDVDARGDHDSTRCSPITRPTRTWPRRHGRWRLHHHPVDADLVPMWTSICAEGLARMIGAGHADRLGTCAGPECDRVFVDLSKNASRRFCSTTCQNRVKAAASPAAPARCSREARGPGRRSSRPWRARASRRAVGVLDGRGPAKVRDPGD